MKEFFSLLIAVYAVTTTFAQHKPMFEDVTASAGLEYHHGYLAGFQINEVKAMACGAAVGDYDDDGYLDLYLTGGDLGPNRLYRNLGDGTFEDVAAQAGVAAQDGIYNGPSFLDFDGDGHMDLFVGGVENTPALLYRNQGDGTFIEVTEQAGIALDGNTFSTAFGDFDRDGDMDLIMAHWIGYPSAHGTHLWVNQGDGTFRAGDHHLGDVYSELDFTFTPNFSDVDDDGWPDLLFVGDFGTTQYFRNQEGTFVNVTTDVFTDENGMGSAIGDYDNDGDLDWFVTSVYNPSGQPSGPGGMTGFSGNRMYRNTGDGVFEDATDHAGVRDGHWGWAAAAVDLDNDGWLDLPHVNGFPMPGFEVGPTKVFMNDRDGTFTERAHELGVYDSRQGRGLVAFDYDNDGDQDLFLANNSDSPILYRNVGDVGRFLNIELVQDGPNSMAMGAKLYLTTGELTQLREIRCNVNFLSQQPARVHFGLGTAGVADLEVRWPDGTISRHPGLAADQFLKIEKPRRQREAVIDLDRRALVRK